MPPDCSGLEVAIVYADADLIEVSLSASNGAFSGRALAYAAPDAVRRFADLIAGFPSSPADEREFTFGEFGSKHAGGAVELKFFCKDSAGHAVLAVRLESDGTSRSAESVSLRFDFEPAAVDHFVQLLRSLRTGHGVAVLPVA